MLGEGTVGAVAFGEVTAQDSADYGEADSSDKKEYAASDVAAEVGDQKDCHARVEEDGDEIAKGASRHDRPPSQEDGGAQRQRNA
jgi:hypothetical protein